MNAPRRRPIPMLPPPATPPRSVIAALCVALGAALGAPMAACETQPSTSTTAPDPDLAALPPFPPPPSPPPARPSPTDAPETASAKLTLLRTDTLPPPSDDKGPIVVLRFSGDARKTLGDAPPVSVTPGGAGALHWPSPRTLHITVAAPVPPSTRLEVSVGGPPAPLVGATPWRPLTATSARFRSWAPDQRQVMERRELVELAFSDPVAPADVRAHFTVAAADDLPNAPANATLPAMSPVPWELLAEVDGKMVPATAPRRRFHFRPTEGFRTGRVYRAALRPTLIGAGGLPVRGTLPRFVLTGPLPFDVTKVRCGWRECVPGSVISVEFSRRLAEDNPTRCFTVSPDVAVSDVEVSWNSVRFTPKVQHVPTRLTVTATTECRSLDGARLPAPRSVEVEFEAPAPEVNLTDVISVARVTAPEATPSLPVRAFGTRRLVVREAPVGMGLEALGQALTFELSPWDHGDPATLPFGPTTTLSTPQTLTGYRRVDVPLSQIQAGKPGWVFVEVRPEGYPGYTGDTKEHLALVQFTELALTAKSGARETVVWVTALGDGAPIAGASVRLLSATGLSLEEAVTDGDGFARLPVAGSPAHGDCGPEAARFAVATLGDDRAFIDLDDWRTRVPTWRFDIPTEWEEVAERPVGLVFTERGIYRPGERVHIKGHVRIDKGGAHESAAGRQALLTLTDPLGQEVFRDDVVLGPHGDFDLDHPTTPGAPTGTWHVRITLVGDPAVGALPGAAALHGAFRVEAFRAPTFEALIPSIEVARNEVRATLGGRYFFGAPMAGTKAAWWVHRRPASFSPSSFPGFTFGLDPWLDDFENRDESSSRILASGDVELDADGRATLTTPFDLAAGKKAELDRSWYVELEVEVTDADAQVSATRRKVRVDPADFHVGVRAADSFGVVGAPVNVEVVAVDGDGVALPERELSLEIIQRTWVSKVEKDASGHETRHSEPVETVVETRTLTSEGAPVVVAITPERAGTHLVRLSGKDAGGRVTRATTAVWVSGRDASWAPQKDGSVPLVAAQPRWAPGQTARFIAQSPFNRANALITVETSKVLWQKRVALEGRAPLIEIPVEPAMAPNAFVSVTLVGQDAAGPADHGAPVAFGYTRFEVSTDDRRLRVEVSPDLASRQPGETVTATLRVTGADGLPARGVATFMAVDESVLALTGYLTPDVHSAVFRQRSLGLRTGDTRTLVLARKAFEDEDMKSEWGGGGESGVATRYRSEFATTAAWMPRVPIDERGEAEVSFTLPDNLTAFRLMAVVASDDGRFGHADARVEVKKPLLVRPGVPRFATAGDTIEVQALVQALVEEARGDVEVHASISGPAALVGETKVRLRLDGQGVTPAAFRLKALSAGSATIAFSVKHTGTGLEDGVELALPIAHPAAARHAITTGVVAGQSTGTHHTGFRLELPEGADPNLGELTIEVQNSRLGALLPALGYVVQYPYGCAEQTTSATVPLLSLHRMKAATTALRIGDDAVLTRIQAGVDRLLSMQTPGGGLGYWPGADEPHPFASAWASLALLEASTVEGVRVPPARLERLLAWLGNVVQSGGDAKSGRATEADAVRPFAAWVLARAGVADPASLTAIFEHRKGLPNFAKAVLGLAIHESRNPAGAAQIETLIGEIKARVEDSGAHALVSEENPWGWRNTMSSDIRSTALLAMLLRATAPADPLGARLEAGLLANQRNGRWNNTQDNAFALLALSGTIAEELGQGAPWRAEVHLGDEVVLEATMPGDSLGAARVVIPMDRLVRANGRALSFIRQGGAGHLHYSMSLRHFPVEPPAAPEDRGYAVTRSYRFAEGPRAGTPVDESLSVGDLVAVELTVTTATRGLYVAVEDPLPAAFEPVLVDAANMRTLPADGREAPEESYGPLVFNHSDTLDDRVVLFSDAMPAGVHAQRYLVRATSSGRFTAPAPSVHEMYSPWVGGDGAPTTLEVRPGS